MAWNRILRGTGGDNFLAKICKTDFQGSMLFRNCSSSTFKDPFSTLYKSLS